MGKRGRSPVYPSHLVIPDTQHRPGVPEEHLLAAGRYALEKRPDTIIHLGDCGDFPSLSSYDSAARKGFDQRDFKDDADAAMRCAELLLQPIAGWNRSHRKRQQYHPRCVVTLGNHEHRIARAAQDAPWLRGVLLEQVDYRRHGWEVIPYQQPIGIDGILYCHMFLRNSKGSVMQGRRGQPSAHQQVLREGMSATAGHKQGLDTHIQPVGDGTRRRGIIAGSYYQHDEGYLSPQGQQHWRGILMCHDVRAGDYDLRECSLPWLRRKYA